MSNKTNASIEELKEIQVNGITYVPKTAEMPKMAEELDGMRYCIIRTYSAGVHAGYVKERDGKEVMLVNARRIWKWSGAFTLSELAIIGPTDPDNCKFAITVPEIILTEAIEIIPCSTEAKTAIEAVADYSCDN